VTACRSGNGDERINEVTLRRARLIPDEWPSSSGQSTSVCNQPPGQLSLLFWHCWLGHLTHKTRPRYDL